MSRPSAGTNVSEHIRRGRSFGSRVRVIDLANRDLSIDDLVRDVAGLREWMQAADAR